LTLAAGLTLPLDAITRTYGIFGQRGTGKSTTAAVLVEQTISNGGRVVVLDPTGVWWGLTREGMGAGLPGVILGGENGDSPLEAESGELVADFVMGQEYPLVVLDMKLMRKGRRVHLAMQFLEKLYHDNREPLLVVFDEAHQFVPQMARPIGEDNEIMRLIGAAEDLVALGRSRGLGAVLISQRMATVNANVREQIETVIWHRLIGKLDRTALKGWIEANAEPEREREVLELIAKLPTGRALVWSPALLDFFGVVNMNNAETFDSRATPKVGQKVKKPGKRAPVDLDTLRVKMAEVIEEHQANDPKLLKQKLAQAEKKVRERDQEIAQWRAFYEDVTSISGSSAVEEVVGTYMAVRKDAGFSADVVDEVRALESRTTEVEVPVLTGNDLVEATTLVNQATGVVKELAGALAPIAEGINKIAGDPASRGKSVIRPETPSATPAPRKPAPELQTPARAPRPAPEPVASDGASGGSNNGQVTNPQQRVLDALAWYEAVGVGTPSRPQVSVVAGYRFTSGGFKNLLGAMRSKGWVTYPSEGFVALTDEGRALAREPDLPHTTDALHGAVYSKISQPQCRVLASVLDAYPDAISREEIAEASRYSVSSGGFKNLLGSLRTLNLIDYPQDGYVRALDWLFPT
jgi:hypothetical protein